MPTISGRSSILTGATSQPLTGSQYEFAPFDGTIEIGLKADKNLVTCSVYSGPDVLAEPGSFVPVGAADEPPKYPDDYHWKDEVAKGDRLKINVVNGNAATTVLYWVLALSPA